MSPERKYGILKVAYIYSRLQRKSNIFYVRFGATEPDHSGTRFRYPTLLDTLFCLEPCMLPLSFIQRYYKDLFIHTVTQCIRQLWCCSPGLLFSPYMSNIIVCRRLVHVWLVICCKPHPFIVNMPTVRCMELWLRLFGLVKPDNQKISWICFYLLVLTFVLVLRLCF